MTAWIFRLQTARFPVFCLTAATQTISRCSKLFLEEANLVKPQTIRNTTQFQLTKSGREALGYFCDRIPNAIQEEADQYLQEHKIELRNEVSVTADYYRTTAKEYAVHCVIKEKESDLIDLTLTVPDKKQAEAMCKSWKNKCEMVYQFLMTQLS